MIRLDEMRRQIQDQLGANPIPDASLTQYAEIVASLSATIDRAARELKREETAADFAAFLESYAEAPTDDA